VVRKSLLATSNTRSQDACCCGPSGHNIPRQINPPANGSHAEIDLGNWVPATTSDKAFRFTVTGKNAASTSFSMCFDYIKLTRQ